MDPLAPSRASTGRPPMHGKGTDDFSTCKGTQSFHLTLLCLSNDSHRCPDSCQTDPIVGPVHDRIELLTGAHYNHSEWYQLLRYEQGQFYGEQ